jgi:hypothetical protein
VVEQTKCNQRLSADVRMLETPIALYVSCHGRRAVCLQRSDVADCAVSWFYMCSAGHGLRSPLNVLLSRTF